MKMHRSSLTNCELELLIRETSAVTLKIEKQCSEYVA